MVRTPTTTTGYCLPRDLVDVAVAGQPADEDHLASGCAPAMNRMASATASGFSLWMLCPVARYSCMPRTYPANSIACWRFYKALP